MYIFPNKIPFFNLRGALIVFTASTIAIGIYCANVRPTIIDVANIRILPSTSLDMFMSLICAFWLTSAAIIINGSTFKYFGLVVFLIVPTVYTLLYIKLESINLIYPSTIGFNEPFLVVLRKVSAMSPLPSSCGSPPTWIQLTGLGFNITPPDPETDEGAGWVWAVRSDEKGSLEPSLQGRFLTLRAFAMNQSRALCAVPTAVGVLPLAVVTTEQRVFPPDMLQRLGVMLIPGSLIGTLLYCIQIARQQIAVPAHLKSWLQQHKSEIDLSSVRNDE